MATKTARRTFYVPHKRVQYDGSDPITGEVLPSATKQEFKAECDINNILKQYKATGMIRHVAAQAGVYQDLPSDLDFQGSLNMVLQAQSAFATLPSLVRERFANDPQRFLAFMANPENAEEMVKLGLVTRRHQDAEAQSVGGGSKEPPKPPASTTSPAPVERKE